MSIPSESEVQDYTAELYIGGITAPEEINAALAEKWPGLGDNTPPSEDPPPSESPSVEDTPPVSDTPPSEEASAQAGEDRYSLKEIFGERFKTIDEFRQADPLGSFEKTSQDLNILRSGIENITRPNLSEEALAYDSFVKATDIKDMGVYSMVSKFDPEGLSGDMGIDEKVATIAMSKILSDPSLLNHHSELIDRIKKDYGLIKYEDEEYTPDTLGLQMEFGPAAGKIKQLKEKVNNFKPEGGEAFDVDGYISSRKEAQAALQEKWTPVVDSFVGSVKKIEVWGGKNPFEVEVPEGALKPFAPSLMQYVMSSGIEPSDEGLKSVQDFATLLWKGQNTESIAKSYAAHITAQEDEAAENPTKIGRGGNNVPPQTEKTGKENADDFISRGLFS